ncbi:hypothetical protein [Accumulibacter sp.]|uniref:Uncharacterized protein n=1 Tax=Candidatus Accumulibacter proximus TaxID=2954385 RepID=A0A935UIA7_9PROT|nr:hypothetical protein [Accumulibacter sp.]MBK7676343.1 hypothetical protein [Candidatus Accumulibacter proximus]MBL8373105.1 hypothetical protein [Accumulibacter sp.]
MDKAPYHGWLAASLPTMPPEPFRDRDLPSAEFASTIQRPPQKMARCYHVLVVVLALMLVPKGIICLAIPLMVAAVVATTW